MSKKIGKLKEEIQIQDLNLDNSIKENIKERNEEIQQMLEHSHAIIEEKASIIHQLNDNIIKNTVASNKLSELKEMCQPKDSLTSTKNLSIYSKLNEEHEKQKREL